LIHQLAHWTGMENNATPDNGSLGTSTNKVKKSTGFVPVKEETLSTVGKNAATQWSQSSLTLMWTNANDFATLTNTYATQLSQRANESTTRPQLTKRLKELDRLIDEGTEYVKGYIEDEVKKENAPAYYSQFGIERVSKNYKLPGDRNSRAIALVTMLKGVTDRGYSNRNYGLAYWQPLVEEYTAKMRQASTVDGNVAGFVGAKNTTKAQVKKTLNALVSLIKANYPETYSSELRRWGFQKEKY
jgi:hypothetical protein